MDTIISHFEILEKIDEGGMGEVFLAKDTVLNRQVALKFLPAQFTTNTVLIDRFKREAQAAAALKHPNIVTVYEMSNHGDKFYIAMEYIDGICLNALMGQRHLPTKKAIVIAIQICRGLRKAHSIGIIHRDIKPANIMIDKDGWVKILDFGLAKLTEHTSITSHGVRMGTTLYISPEQLRGQPLKPGSDIFSLGVLLYQLLAQRHPFAGNTEQEIMYSIINKDPEPLVRYNADVTPGLQRIVEKALRKDPAERFQNVDDLMADLKREKVSYARQRRPRIRKSRSRTITLNIRDVNSDMLRDGVARIKPFLISGSKAVARKKIGSSRKWAIAFSLSLFLVILAGVAFSRYGFRTNTQTVSRIERIEPIRALLKEQDTDELMKHVEILRRQKLISVGKDVDFAFSDDCYLFIMDSLNLLDVFEIKDNMFRSLYSQERFATPPNRFSGKTKVWIQDLTAKR